MRRFASATKTILAILALAMAAPSIADENVVVLYPAYGAAGRAVIEGRVIGRRDLAPENADDSRRTNLHRNLKLLVNRERANVPVAVSLGGREFETLTDHEGYFRVTLNDLHELADGWHRVSAKQGMAQSAGDLLLVPPTNTVGVISDIDDTLLVSQVTSKRSLLANTFLKNPGQRQAVAGTPSLLRDIAARNPLPETTPVLYLSASPRQLYGNIERFLTHNDFPPGILLTKRVTHDASSDPLLDQIAYKMAKIEEILQRLPQVRFVLLGDDGERDPEIYHQIRQRFPERVEQVIIRRVRSDPKRPVFVGQLDMAKFLKAPE